MHATCSMKWLRGHHAAELVPPWVTPPPRLCCYLGQARGTPYSFIHSPSLPLPLSSPPRRSPRRPEPCPPWPAGIARGCRCTGRAWPRLAMVRVWPPLFVSTPRASWSEKQTSPFSVQEEEGRDLRLEYETTQGSRCEAKTRIVFVGCGVIHGRSWVPEAKVFSFFFCFCRFLVELC